MLTVTDNALKQIQIAKKESNAETMALRIAARFTNDKHIEYTMGFDEQKESDEVVKINDILIIVDKNSQGLLEDATMDYVEYEPENFKFIFLNPLDPQYVAPKTAANTAKKKAE